MGPWSCSVAQLLGGCGFQIGPGTVISSVVNSFGPWPSIFESHLGVASFLTTALLAWMDGMYRYMVFVANKEAAGAARWGGRVGVFVIPTMPPGRLPWLHVRGCGRSWSGLLGGRWRWAAVSGKEKGP